MPHFTPPDRRLELSHAINRLSEATLRGDTTPGVLQALVDIAGPVLDADRALIYDVQFSSGLAVGLCEWLRPTVGPTKATYRLDLFGAAAREMAQTGAAIESSRSAIHPTFVRDGSHVLLHEQMGIQRLIWHPFRHRPDGYFLLVLNRVLHDRDWSPEERDFIAQVAAQVSLAIMKLDLLRERERTETELRTSEMRFRLLYDHTPSMFFTVGPDDIVQMVNRFAVEHLGYAAEELLDQNVLTVVHEDDRAEVRRHLAACFGDPGKVRTVSFRKICKDGRVIWVKETTRVVDGPEGPRALIVCEDVTEARAHEEAARRAELRSNDKDEFIAMLGHELRNPLSPIVASLEAIRLQGQASGEIDIIERQVSQLRRLVDDLLDVSRLTRGTIVLKKERVEMAVVAVRAAELAQPLFQQRNQTLSIVIPSEGLTLDVDLSRLVQAFANFLNNAAKFSDRGQTVLFTAERSGNRVLVRVRDQGQGIEPDMLERVFEGFVQRVHPGELATSGLGLGLTIARNLIVLHGGTVTAHSGGPGQGTEIVVDVPVAEEPSRETLPKKAEKSTQSAAVAPGTSVLVVEDNEDVRRSLLRLLRLVGYHAVVAPDGPSALATAAETRPRVAVVDIGLPGMDGYELARRLRSEHPTMRLVALTGYGQPSAQARSREAGFDAHLTKPVDLSVLRPLLDEVC
jgi:two-component system CheB/CheR fusion protein